MCFACSCLLQAVDLCCACSCLLQAVDLCFAYSCLLFLGRLVQDAERVRAIEHALSFGEERGLEINFFTIVYFLEERLNAGVNIVPGQVKHIE